MNLYCALRRPLHQPYAIPGVCDRVAGLPPLR
jgi:hypothetical protein